MNERCLQQMTGDCGGCGVQDILTTIISREALASTAPGQPPVEATAIAQKVAANYCPAGTNIRVEPVRHSAIW